VKYVQSRLTHLGVGLLTLAVFLGGVSPAAAQPLPVIITGDENGNGTITLDSNPAAPHNGNINTDPGPGGRPNALLYGLPGMSGVVAGDVFVTEPGGAVGDLLRFNNITVPATLFFYSQPGGTDLADLPGFPTANYTNVLTIPEINGVISYTPTASQPGFVTGFAMTYILSSPDPAAAVIPEPPSYAILAGCLGLAGWWWRRRAVATA